MLPNCFPFTPIIMKLHTKSPDESRMCHMAFGVKRSKVKVIMHWLLKMVFGALPLSPSAFIKLPTQILSESRICPNYIGIKNLGEFELVAAGGILPRYDNPIPVFFLVLFVLGGTYGKAVTWSLHPVRSFALVTFGSIPKSNFDAFLLFLVQFL